MEEEGGKGGGATEDAFFERGLHECLSTGGEMRVCVKWGIVEMRGARAQGFVDDIKSCSRVGSMKCMNFRAALDPQGNFSGRSKVLPNRMLSAEYVFKNRP